MWKKEPLCADVPNAECRSRHDHVLDIYSQYRTQTDESARSKSETKSIRDRERIIWFRKQRKETRTDSVFKNLPFSTAHISVIQFQTLETYVEKYNKHNFAIDEYDI